jgi:hypothetical protein
VSNIEKKYSIYRAIGDIAPFDCGIWHVTGEGRIESWTLHVQSIFFEFTSHYLQDIILYSCMKGHKIG